MPARVVLGVGAGIAAYKACELLRLLTESGYRVRVVPTPQALRFVGEATWAALSGEPVTTDVWTGVSDVPHVRLGQSADLVVVAPATADLIARTAAGMADDLLTSTLLTARCPVLYAPAMHTEMWQHPAIQANVSLLRSRGAIVLEPAVGRLTGADSGAGRLPDPSEIFSAAVRLLAHSGAGTAYDLAGRRVVVSAGGTREEIDPVRFIGNWSTGTQGYALARAAVARGAEVTVVAANVALPDPAGASVIRVVSAREMQSAITAAAARRAATARSRRTGSRRSRCAWSRIRTSWPACVPSAPPAPPARSWSDSPPRRIPPSRRPGPSSPARDATCWWSTRWGTGSASARPTTRRSSSAPTGRSRRYRAGPRKRSPTWFGTWSLST
jgi:phosphopantothenoylcysteine decarboxylase / phosphopantothenate---cysteine ligase